MMVIVVMIGLIASVLFSATAIGPVYMEQSAVENNLAELRARWAIIGGFRYAISRTYHSRLCQTASSCASPETDAIKATALQAYLNEISGIQTWTYPEEASGYRILTSLTAAVDDKPTRNASSGHLMMTGRYPAGQSTLGILSGATTRMGPLELRYCVGLAWSGALCGPITSNNGGAMTSFYSVKRLTRLIPGS
jgi:hypothetical protein